MQNTLLRCGQRSLDLSTPQVMGILNVTPDSFSDGGTYNNLEQAMQRARQMVADGAGILDIGGESTRPGAQAVAPQQELDRVAPLLEAVVKELDVVVSVDTSTPLVMRESARLGAGIINDVRSLQREGALQAAMETDLAVCLMHMRGEPQTMQDAPEYDSILQEVTDFLAERLEVCRAAGISDGRLLLDPGFGFAKTLQHNLSLFRQQAQLASFALPVLVGVSRKSMIGQVLDRPVDERLYGSLALAVMALERGAKILRVHDVRETVDVVKMHQAVCRVQE